jgi:hypothetical protein
MKIRVNIRIATIPPKNAHIYKNLLLLFSDIYLFFKRRIRKKMKLFLGGV